MNALLYISVIIIWGTTWFAIYLQQGDVPVTVSIFYRFLLAAVIMLYAWPQIVLWLPSHM